MSAPECIIRVARQAMATRFEIALYGGDPIRLRAAAEEALTEVERLEQQLSLYDETSEVSRINARAGREEVVVSPALFSLIQRAAALSEITSGAFDLTVAPLMQCWGFVRGTGSLPTAEAIASAMAKVGMENVRCSKERFSIRFVREGMRLDFGALGKGYAIDQAVSLLRDAGIENALIHGGTSTVFGMGCQPDGSPWKVAIELPEVPGTSPAVPIAMAELRNEALSVSAIWGKSFQSGERELGHVLDPRSGQPVAHASLAGVVVESAAESDALSTALLVMGRPGWEVLAHHCPSMRGVVVGPRNPPPPWIHLNGLMLLCR